jgi:glucokinase
MIGVHVDLGGTRIKIMLIKDGTILDSAILDADAKAGLHSELPNIAEQIKRLSQRERPEGIGFAFPGMVNPVTKRVTAANGKYMDAMDVDLETWAREQFDLPLIFDNDANAALLGELYYGCAKGFSNAVILILGTGIGTAAMINGKLLRGVHFLAGCRGGHFCIGGVKSGNQCNCGSRGCAEAYGGSWAMEKAVREDPLFTASGLSTEPIIDFKVLEKWDKAGDRLAIQIIEQCIDSWSACAITLIHAYDPEVVILSGGVIHYGERIIQPISDNIDTYAWTPCGKSTIRVSNHPEYSVVFGLHYLLENSMYAVKN